MGSTVAPKKPAAAANGEHKADNQHLEFKDLLLKAKEKISPEQALRLNSLENSVVRGDVKDQKIHVYHQLARFWSDSAKLFEPYAWYTGEAAKLENSEKSLTFAAQLYIDNLVTEGDPAMQHWLAEQAKDLLDKALVINPNNDSSKIGLGACYIFGNISNNPMEGILPIRDIVQKNPNNLYAQMILALGGKKSGQLEKKKIKLSLSEEAEWETYFRTEAKKALELKLQIDRPDKEIDQMVYQLYKLTELEIKIVEKN